MHGQRAPEHNVEPAADEEGWRVTDLPIERLRRSHREAGRVIRQPSAVMGGIAVEQRHHGGPRPDAASRNL